MYSTIQEDIIFINLIDKKAQKNIELHTEKFKNLGITDEESSNPFT